MSLVQLLLSFISNRTQNTTRSRPSLAIELLEYHSDSDPGQSESDDEDFASLSSADAEYFATASLNTLEDVAEAISTCKRNILETTENTPSRKAMVNRLIQLQIRQEDLKEKTEISANSFETRGHTFVSFRNNLTVPGVSDFRGVYCQQCGNAIWVQLQSSQFCSDCGFSVHATCMDNIMRTCVAIKARTQPDFIMDICPERALPALKYRCCECDIKFSRTDIKRQPRLCDYTGTTILRTGENMTNFKISFLRTLILSWMPLERHVADPGQDHPQLGL